MRRLAAIALVAALAPAAPAGQVFITVPGFADPYLSGLPAGSTASAYAPSSLPADVAPGQSPVLVPSLPLAPGLALTFNVTGAVAYGPAPNAGPDFKWSGPDGALYNGSFIHHLAGAEHGLSDAWVPINALLGVFLDASAPGALPAPTTLDFRPGGNVPGGTGYASLSPALGQVFFIGDGLDGASAAQVIVTPGGATRLFLGTADGWEWANNRGEYAVTVSYGATPASAVPEPGTLALAAMGAAGAGAYWLRRRRLPA